MTRLSASIRRLVGRLYDCLLLGRWTSLAGMFLFGLIVYLFLFSTVHQREVSQVLSGFPDRYSKTIMVWIEHGYFKHGGLRFLEPIDANPTQQVWNSSSMGFLQAAHLLQRIHYGLTGKFSQRLMVLHNQAWVWLSSALLGLLGMRLALRIKVKPLHALLFGIACTVIYQTFPVNLWYYWEVYPTTVLSLFAILFLLIEEVMFERTSAPPWIFFIRGICVFALVYVEPYDSALFLLAYYFISLVLSPQVSQRLSVVFWTLLGPAILALFVFATQLLWIRLKYPLLTWVGGKFMYRTGLDGSTQYYLSHLDLVLSRLSIRINPQLALLSQWWFLFIASSLAVMVIVRLYLTRLPHLKCAVFTLTIAIGLYLPFAFLFSQATIIHPYGYDVFLVIPLILALFVILPSSLEKLTNGTGIFTIITLILAFCYSMVQLRTYAMAFPLTN